MKNRAGLVMRVFALLVTMACSAAFAADYPSRQIRVIVPFPPGSTLDALTRIVTDQLAQTWGQPVVVENLSGGGGNIGTGGYQTGNVDRPEDEDEANIGVDDGSSCIANNRASFHGA